MNRTALKEQIGRRLPGRVQCQFATDGPACEVICERAALAELCGRLFLEWNFSFAGLIVEDEDLEYTKAAAIGGFVAIGAALALHAVGAGQLGGLEVQGMHLGV